VYLAGWGATQRRLPRKASVSWLEGWAVPTWRPHSVRWRGRPPAGFTLLELLIVVVILGILAAVVVPRFAISAGTAKRNACDCNLARISTQVDRWYFEKQSWPKIDLSDISADTDYFPDGVPRCPVDNRVYQLNPTTHRVKRHDH